MISFIFLVLHSKLLMNNNDNRKKDRKKEKKRKRERAKNTPHSSADKDDT